MQATLAIAIGLGLTAAAPVGTPKILASTTDFGFGSNTACNCNGEPLSKTLIEKHGYVAVATPDWMLTPFLSINTATASGDSTPATAMGKPYTSNCGNGKGGCGKCWKLTTRDEPNIYGRKTTSDGTPSAPFKQHEVKVVVIDACEDRNAYGNNWQWCLPFKLDSSLTKGLPINANGYAGHNITDAKSFLVDPTVPYTGYPGAGAVTVPYDSLHLGQFSHTDKETDWRSEECYDVAGNWICTNLAGQPYHFDFGIQQMDDDFLEKHNIWKKSTNPLVEAEMIECDDGVIEELQGFCGANSVPSDKGGPDYQQCLNYCTTSDPKEPNIPFWLGGCDTDPKCKPVYSNCEAGDCCQFGQTCMDIGTSSGTSFYQCSWHHPPPAPPSPPSTPNTPGTPPAGCCCYYTGDASAEGQLDQCPGAGKCGNPVASVEPGSCSGSNQLPFKDKKGWTFTKTNSDKSIAHGFFCDVDVSEC